MKRTHKWLAPILDWNAYTNRPQHNIIYSKIPYHTWTYRNIAKDHQHTLKYKMIPKQHTHQKYYIIPLHNSRCLNINQHITKYLNTHTQPNIVKRWKYYYNKLLLKIQISMKDHFKRLSRYIVFSNFVQWYHILLTWYVQ